MEEGVGKEEQQVRLYLVGEDFMQVVAVVPESHSTVCLDITHLNGLVMVLSRSTTNLPSG